MKIVVFLSYHLNRLRVDVITKLPLFFEKNNAPPRGYRAEWGNHKTSSLNWLDHRSDVTLAI